MVAGFVKGISTDESQLPRLRNDRMRSGATQPSFPVLKRQRGVSSNNQKVPDLQNQKKQD